MGSYRLHQQILDNLENRIVRLHSEVHREEPYSSDGWRLMGETDLYVIDRDRLLLFEIKSSKDVKKYKKAIIQLERARRYYSEMYQIDNVYGFYVNPYGIKRIF